MLACLFQTIRQVRESGAPRWSGLLAHILFVFAKFLPPRSLLCSLSSAVFNTTLLTLFLSPFLFFSLIFFCCCYGLLNHTLLLFQCFSKPITLPELMDPLPSQTEARTVVCVYISPSIRRVNFSLSLRALTASLHPVTQSQSKENAEDGQRGFDCQ